MNYDQVVKNLQTLLEIPLNQEDENFRRIIPLMFTYADNRIYRELEFLATTSVTTGALTANSRETPLPSTMLVLRQMNVLVPTGYAWAGLVQRKALERISPEALDMFWTIGPAFTADTPVDWAVRLLPRGVPEKFAVIGTSTATFPQTLSYVIRLMPTPDKAYATEFFGVTRPALLSSTNTETFLSANYADLFCAACMVFASGYQRDFGAMADDPQKAISWNGTYESLRQGAILEAGRMKGMLPAMGGVPAAGGP
jgi:hypothetical protein